jgi:hypothetical protein
MIEPGRYRARAIEGALGKAKTGTEQIEVRFQLLDRPESLIWRGFFTDATEEWTMKALEIAGWQWTPCTFPPDAPEVSLVVEHEEGRDGKMYARVRWVNEQRKLAPKQPLTDEELSALKIRLTRDQSYPAIPPAAVRAETQATEDDFDPNQNDDDGLPF